jgi:hypothetical protein
MLIISLYAHCWDTADLIDKDILGELDRVIEENGRRKHVVPTPHGGIRGR